MPTRLSDKAFFERQDVASFLSDQPMDSGYVWTLGDNINHLVDEVGKYRLNWMARHVGEIGEEHVGRFRDVDRIWYTIFPTQPVIDSQYPRYDVRIATLQGVATTLRISLVTPGTTAPILSSDQPGVIGTFTSELDGLTLLTWSEALFPAKENRSAPFYVSGPAPSVDSSVFSFGPLILVKLLIECLEPTDLSGGPFIIGAQVREYLR